ncbi:transposase family protein [Nocardia sp. NPDC052278]|uniref:transposase family protein n=1 Tax=unclassified Nocardia TaxID=2637762 RepID=UPI0036BDB979
MTRHAQREAQLHQRRGRARQTAPGTDHKAVLSLDDRLAITLLHLRFSTRQHALATLFAVAQQTVHKTIQQVRPLLDLAGHAIHPTGITLADAKAVSQYKATVKQARSGSTPGADSTASTMARRSAW